MSNSECNERVERAARILLLAADGTTNALRKAMAFVGFTSVQRLDRTIHQQIRRKKQTLFAEQKKAPPSQPIPPLDDTTTISKRPPLSSLQVESVARRIGSTKKMRMASRQASTQRKATAEERRMKDNATKKATLAWKKDLQKPEGTKRKSAETIVHAINEEDSVDLVPRIIRNLVKNGLAGCMPVKRDEKGYIPLRAYKALCGAFESFI
jgi:predicted component of type VI protein secretion system